MKNAIIYGVFLELQDLNKQVNAFVAFYAANCLDREPKNKTRTQIISEANKLILQLQKIEGKIDILGKKRGLLEKSLLQQAISEQKTAVANIPKE